MMVCQAGLIVLIASFTFASGAKIVILPAAQISHVSQGENIANALLKKGHDIYMILPDHHKKLDKFKSGPIKILTHHTPEKDMLEQGLVKSMVDLFGVPLKEVMRHDPPGGRENCINVLSDEKFYQTLKDLKPDLFMLDTFSFTQCVYTLPYRLGLPYISYGTAHLSEWPRSVRLPSFTPHKVATPYTEKMTFFERLDNLVTTIDFAWFPKPPYLRDNWVEQYAPERPPVSLDVLLKRSSLWLIHNDIIIDYPRPLMPNEIFVGGLTTKSAEPLPDDLEKIVDSAQHGVIVMSFGSGLPDLNSEKFVSVFSKLKQVVLWRHLSDYQGDVPVPKNVHMLKWLPQSDLLGHNNTKLFITHGGSNGQFEALYHGVPMLAFPAFAEQPFNARRMAYHGFGRVMNIMSFTEYELKEAITDIITNPSYMQKIKHASKIFRSRPETPLERVTYWVDHILQYGDGHLKSYAIEMPWYSYWMLDIFIFLALVITVATILLSKIFKWCCCRSRSKEKTA